MALIFYSKTTNGFYHDDIHALDQMPLDKVSVTPEQYKNFFDGQLAGKIISSDENGNPILVDHVFTANDLREKRNALLAQTDWTQGVDVPQATKDKWATYRQALRELPQQSTFPTSVVWPAQPT